MIITYKILVPDTQNINPSLSETINRSKPQQDNKNELAQTTKLNQKDAREVVEQSKKIISDTSNGALNGKKSLNIKINEQIAPNQSNISIKSLGNKSPSNQIDKKTTEILLSPKNVASPNNKNEINGKKTTNAKIPSLDPSVLKRVVEEEIPANSKYIQSGANKKGTKSPSHSPKRNDSKMGGSQNFPIVNSDENKKDAALKTIQSPKAKPLDKARLSSPQNFQPNEEKPKKAAKVAKIKYDEIPANSKYAIKLAEVEEIPEPKKQETVKKASLSNKLLVQITKSSSPRNEVTMQKATSSRDEYKLDKSEKSIGKSVRLPSPPSSIMNSKKFDEKESETIRQITSIERIRSMSIDKESKQKRGKSQNSFEDISLVGNKSLAKSKLSINTINIPKNDTKKDNFDPNPIKNRYF